MKTVQLVTIRLSLAAIVVSLTTLLAGCSSGSKLHPVKGTVTFEGQPVKTGSITFRFGGPSGRAYSGVITDGHYELKSEAGSATVEITASRIIPGKFDKSNGTPEPMGEMYIPAKYNESSNLTKQVEAKPNEISFELTK